jgi:hypothetical protein
MAELTLRFDMSFGTRSLRCLMAAGMIFSAVTEVASESVTLNTYYPAPSGVYAQMITTNNTYLARDGGGVTIGGSGAAPAGGLAFGAANPTISASSYIVMPGGLYVSAGTAYFQNQIQTRGGVHDDTNVNLSLYGGTSGNTNVTGGLFASAYLPSYMAWATYGTGPGGAAIYNDNGAYQTLMLVGNNSAGGTRRVSVWDQLLVNGTEYVASGSYNASSFVNGAGASCGWTTYTVGSLTPICAGGQYVTLETGVMSKYTTINNGTEPDGDAFCCPCPAGLNVGYANSCPSL